MNYYNEFDPKAAAWLRELIKADLIPEGDVDERDIRQVSGHELERYQQCHFFAGIGGWPYALQLAGWPDDVRVWTGSCPCQPLSSAGQRKGEMDERHLWPEFYRLIAQCRPATVFGEQVASSDGLEWLDGVSLDLEEIGYAIGAATLTAAGVGSPHLRERLYFVADSKGEGRCWRQPVEARSCRKPGRSSQDVRAVAWPDHSGSGSALAVADVLSPSYGVSGRVGRLRGYGNAIVPQVAAKFIRSYIEAAA
jgi:DNA (cytosine-5)-methyltransferase 1